MDRWMYEWIDGWMDEWICKKDRQNCSTFFPKVIPRWDLPCRLLPRGHMEWIPDSQAPHEAGPPDSQFLAPELKALWVYTHAMAHTHIHTHTYTHTVNPQAFS